MFSSCTNFVNSLGPSSETHPPLRKIGLSYLSPGGVMRVPERMLFPRPLAYPETLPVLYVPSPSSSVIRISVPQSVFLSCFFLPNFSEIGSSSPPCTYPCRPLVLFPLRTVPSPPSFFVFCERLLSKDNLPSRSQGWYRYFLAADFLPSWSSPPPNCLPFLLDTNRWTRSATVFFAPFLVC